MPLALPADATLVADIAPGIVWLALLLAVILLLDKLFLTDFMDQGIVHWYLSPSPMLLMIYCRLLTVSILFLVACCALLPLFMLLYQLSFSATLHLALTFLLGIPSLIAIGAIFSALLVGVGSRSVLLPLLILPLWSPILIFASNCLYQQQLGLPTLSHFALLGAIFVISLAIAPLAIQAALHLGLDHETH